MRGLPVLLTVDRCGYGDGACAARVDVAESVRERLNTISPLRSKNKISEKIRMRVGLGWAGRRT